MRSLYQHDPSRHGAQVDFPSPLWRPGFLGLLLWPRRGASSHNHPRQRHLRWHIRRRRLCLSWHSVCSTAVRRIFPNARMRMFELMLTCRVGDLRFQLPVANDPYLGTYNATTSGAACIQQLPRLTDTSNLNPTAAEILQQTVSTIASSAPPDDEDCKMLCLLYRTRTGSHRQVSQSTFMLLLMRPKTQSYLLPM